jgi:hypothetical protein
VPEGLCACRSLMRLFLTWDTWDKWDNSIVSLFSCLSFEVHYNGMELDPKFMDVIVQRWQGMSGRKAVLDGDGRTFAEISAERAEVAA